MLPIKIILQNQAHKKRQDKKIQPNNRKTVSEVYNRQQIDKKKKKKKTSITLLFTCFRQNEERR